MSRRKTLLPQTKEIAASASHDRELQDRLAENAE
jgi:hypothetical protein